MLPAKGSLRLEFLRDGRTLLPKPLSGGTLNSEDVKTRIGQKSVISGRWSVISEGAPNCANRLR